MAIVEHYTCRHFAMMDRLQVQRPDISPRATGHIPEQLQLIETLLAQGKPTKETGRSTLMFLRIPNTEFSLVAREKTC